MRRILLLPLVDRCMYMAHVCFYGCCSDCVGVCGKFVVSLLKIVFFLALEC